MEIETTYGNILKFFIFTENKQCGTRLEYGIWRNCHINFVVFPDGNNIDSEFFRISS